MTKKENLMKRTIEQKSFFEAGSSLWMGMMFALVLFVSVSNTWCGFQMIGEGFLINSLASVVIISSVFVSVFLFFLVSVSDWKLWKLGFLEPAYTLFFLLAVSGILYGFDRLFIFASSFIIVFAGFHISINQRFRHFAGEYDINIVGLATVLWVQDHKPAV